MLYEGKERYINPYTDFGFKKLFGTEMNKDLLISFLNALFNGHEVIQDITYLNSEQLGSGYLNRKAIFDVYCENERGEKFIVGMQAEIARFTPQDARDYEESIKVYRDLTNVVNTAEQKGENRRALVIAQEMKKDGMSNILIAKYTGLSKEQIDLQIELTAVPFSDLSKMQPGEPSSVIRERVIKARNIQEQRFQGVNGVHCNAQMTEKMLHQFAEPDAASLDMLRMAMERLKLSARAYSRILKVARTIADLEGSEQVQSQHIAEAIGYRNLDRSDWAERGL